MSSSAAATVTPLADRDVLMLDLDGVVYRGAGAVPHAIEALTDAEASGVRLQFVTNNASRPPAVVADHLRDLGLAASADDVVTSAQAGAAVLAERIGTGRRVLAVGGPGVALALQAAGMTTIPSAEALRSLGADHPPQAELELAAGFDGVLQGFGADVSWRDLTLASYAVAAGAVWVATNTDRTIPRAGGIAPGNGTLVECVRAATRVDPPVAGKPHAPIMQEAIRRSGAVTPLVVGDRLDTDIAGAHAAGLESLLVLTGVSGLGDLFRAPVALRPTFVAIDLRDLSRPSRRLIVGNQISAMTSSVRVQDGRLLTAEPASRDEAVEMLVDCATTAWDAHDRLGVDLQVDAAAATLARFLAVPA